MNLSDEVDLEDYVSRPDKISAAEVCFFEEAKSAMNEIIMFNRCCLHKFDQFFQGIFKFEKYLACLLVLLALAKNTH